MVYGTQDPEHRLKGTVARHVYLPFRPETAVKIRIFKKILFNKVSFLSRTRKKGKMHHVCKVLEKKFISYALLKTMYSIVYTLRPISTV
jgi:hypothetical protein